MRVCGGGAGGGGGVQVRVWGGGRGRTRREEVVYRCVCGGGRSWCTGACVGGGRGRMRREEGGGVREAGGGRKKGGGGRREGGRGRRAEGCLLGGAMARLTGVLGFLRLDSTLHRGFRVPVTSLRLTLTSPHLAPPHLAPPTPAPQDAADGQVRHHPAAGCAGVRHQHPGQGPVRRGAKGCVSVCVFCVFVCL